MKLLKVGIERVEVVGNPLNKRRDDFVYRITFDGRGIGPPMDLHSTLFLRDWFNASRESFEHEMSKLKIETTFYEAIGIIAKPDLSPLEGPSTEPLAIETEPGVEAEAA